MYQFATVVGETGRAPGPEKPAEQGSSTVELRAGAATVTGGLGAQERARRRLTPAELEMTGRIMLFILAESVPGGVPNALVQLQAHLTMRAQRAIQ